MTQRMTTALVDSLSLLTAGLKHPVAQRTMGMGTTAAGPLRMMGSRGGPLVCRSARLFCNSLIFKVTMNLGGLRSVENSLSVSEGVVYLFALRNQRSRRHTSWTDSAQLQ